MSNHGQTLSARLMASQLKVYLLIIVSLVGSSPLWCQDPALEYRNRGKLYQDSSQWDSAIYYFGKAADVYGNAGALRAQLECEVNLNYARISALQFEPALSHLQKLLPKAKRRWPSQDTTVAHLLDVLGKLYNETGAYHEARISLEESISIKESQRCRPEDLSRTTFELGNAYREMGELDLAMQTYERDLEIRKEIYGDDNIHTVTVYNNIAIILKNTSRFDEALTVYLRCDSILLEHYGDDDQRRAPGLNGIAIIYAQTGKYPEALIYFNELVNIDKKTLGESHPYLARTYSNLGILHELMGDYKSAQDFHKKSLSIKLKSFEPDNPNLIADYKGLSIIMSHVGDIDQALLYQRQVLQMEKGNYSENDPRIATTHVMIASSLAKKGEFAEAWQNLKYAEKIFLNNGEQYLELGPVYHTMASNLDIQGQYKDALPYAYKALDINQQAGEDHPHVAGNHILIGDIYLHLHDIDSALYHYYHALKINRKVFGDKHLEVAGNYGRIADLYFTADNFPNAMENIQLALDAATEGYDYRNNNKNPVPDQTLIPNTVAALLGAKGKMVSHYAQQKDDDQLLLAAMSTFDAAITMIDAAQFSYKAQGSVLNLRDELDPVFEEAIDVAYTLYQKKADNQYLEKAFQISEKNKAALLVSAINESRAKAFAGIPDSLTNLEQQIKRDLTYFEYQLSQQKNTPGADSQLTDELQNGIFRLKAQHDQLIEYFNQNYPQYFHLKYDRRPASLNIVKNQLEQKNDLLIEYYLSKNYLYIFTIGQNNETLTRTNINGDFFNLIEKLKISLSSGQEPLSSVVKTSHQLYQYLIQPVEQVLNNQKITIIPDGEIGYIPFEILINEPSPNQHFDLPYLLKKHAICYAFSATYLQEQAANTNGQKEIKYLAFAPDFNGRDEEGDAMEKTLVTRQEVERGSLAELLGAKIEVESLSKHFPGISLKEAEATEANFKKLAHDYTILHLATHAIIDEVNPLNSRLLFTMDSDSIEDGDLNAWELFNMQINARLAVLSACNTGFGKVQKGEGVLSLGRAFAYAGCPSRLMSLWPAQDASTAELMVSFYQNLADGLSKDEALRQAKLQYLEEANDFNLHPFYWAGFVLQGDPSPIYDSSPILPLLLGSSMILILGFLIFRTLRSK